MIIKLAAELATAS